MENPNLAIHPGQIQAAPTGETTVILPFEEFAVDLEHNLGRANGNIYHRTQGVPNVHDGQIMIRLKKKRFIVVDYSIVPSPADVACAAVTPHIKCPPGAGTMKCTSSTCTKVGVPVCLFDSDPEEPTSLYLRSGLCFTCQRLLNEKRRTQRKRKGDRPKSDGGAHDDSFGAGQKRFRMGGEILDLNNDAIIVNGPLEGTKHHGPGYEYPQIIEDLQKIAAEVAHETEQLSAATCSLAATPTHNSPEHVQIDALYNKTFLTVSKGIFLLSQWKSSFDTTVNASIAEKATEEVLESASIADVVASAAAVAAAQSAEVAGGEQAQSNMIPLLLASEGKEGEPDPMEKDKEEVTSNVEI